MHINQAQFLSPPPSLSFQVTQTHGGIGQKRDYDIAYFGGPRLQAVGIATDQESHFHRREEGASEGKFPLVHQEMKKKEKDK